MLKKILFFLLAPTFIHAQINVTAPQTAAALAQTLVGSGVSISNPSLTCANNAQGKFNIVASNLGLDSGIILTTGQAQTTALATGCNAIGATYTTVNGTGSDPDLAILTAPQTSEDKCILEFDFIPLGDTVKFDYVFGSCEYQFFTCSIADVFGFFISGPGIVGPFIGGAKNIALIPGTNCPVGVNTINASTSNPCGGVTAPCAPPNNALFNNNLGGLSVAYNGFTDVLRAETAVIPCSTYHLKLAICDASDEILDSGVFIKAGSLSTNAIEVKLNAGLINASGTPYIIEGCDSAKLTIKRRILQGTIYPDTVNLQIIGTAINGVDYTTLPTQVTFAALASDTVKILNLYAFPDAITEGTEFLKIYVLSGCAQFPTDSITIEVKDSLSYSLFNTDTSICLGNSVTINGQIDVGINLQWTPSTNVANPNILLTTITPTTIGQVTYTATGTYGSCTPVVKTLKITTDPIPFITPIADMEVCEGNTINISAIVSPSFNYNFNWNPSTSLLNTNTYNPIFNGTTSQNIVLHVESPNAKCSTDEPFFIQVWPFAQGNISNDTLVCNGNPVQLFVSGGNGQYFWYPSTGLSCTSCPNPIASNSGSTQYFAVLLDPHGCQDTLDVHVEIQPGFTMFLYNNDTTIYAGEEIKLLATGAPYYYWTPGNYLYYVQSNDPTAKPLEDITYYVTGVNVNQKCPQVDSFHVKVITQDINVPNAFTPNGDGKNDVFKVFARKMITMQEFRIFNRWGQEIYSSTDITKGWDGSYKGKPQDPGVYFYTMKVNYINGKVQHIQGDITLIR